MSKNEKLRLAAKEFAEKAKKLSNVLEIVLVGSVAGNDPYPNDLDITIIINDLDEVSILAKYGRQIAKYFQSWDIFVLDKDLKYLGILCHRKECPTNSVDCYVKGCGQPPHLRVFPEFEYDEKIFLESPVEILWTTYNESRLIARRRELGILESRKYPVLEDIKIECIDCGKMFTFTAGEQKRYQKMGLSTPKRCSFCQHKRH